MKRIVILGRGGAGKSTLAIKLSKLIGVPVIELDKHFWQPGLLPTPPDKWKKVQQKLLSSNEWVIDGDLGKYDVLEPRLEVADTVIVLDYSFIRCFKQARRRSSERLDFWWWVFTWRWASRPKVIKAIKSYAKQADVYIIRTPKQLEEFLGGLA